MESATRNAAIASLATVSSPRILPICCSLGIGIFSSGASAPIASDMLAATELGGTRRASCAQTRTRRSCGIGAKRPRASRRLLLPASLPSSSSASDSSTSGSSSSVACRCFSAVSATFARFNRLTDRAAVLSLIRARFFAAANFFFSSATSPAHCSTAFSFASTCRTRHARACFIRLFASAFDTVFAFRLLFFRASLTDFSCLESLAIVLSFFTTPFSCLPCLATVNFSSFAVPCASTSRTADMRCAFRARVASPLTPPSSSHSCRLRASSAVMRSVAVGSSSFGQSFCRASCS